MFFYLSKIVAFFIWPSSVVTMLLVVGIGSMVLGRAVKWGRRASVAGVALLLACGFGPVGNWLMLPLEERFARGALPADVAGILILGGFELGSIGNARGELALNEAAERLTEGILVALKRPGAKVAFSGDDGTLFRTAGSAANTVGQYLEAVGIARPAEQARAFLADKRPDPLITPKELDGFGELLVRGERLPVGVGDPHGIRVGEQGVDVERAVVGVVEDGGAHGIGWHCRPAALEVLWFEEADRDQAMATFGEQAPHIAVFQRTAGDCPRILHGGAERFDADVYLVGGRSDWSSRDSSRPVWVWHGTYLERDEPHRGV